MKENIDKLFKDGLQNRDFDFDEQDWHAFKAMQQAPKKKRRGLAWWWRVPIAATLLLGIGITAYYANKNIVAKDSTANVNALLITDLKDSQKNDVTVLDKNVDANTKISNNTDIVAHVDNSPITRIKNNFVADKIAKNDATITNDVSTEILISDKNTKINPSTTTEKTVETIVSAPTNSVAPSTTTEKIVEPVVSAPTNSVAPSTNGTDVANHSSNEQAAAVSNTLVLTEKTNNLSETIATILDNNKDKTINIEDLLTKKTTAITPKKRWTWEGISIAAGFAPEQYQKTGQSFVPTSVTVPTVYSSTIYGAIGTNFARQMNTAWRFVTGLRYSYRGSRVYTLQELQLAAETQDALFSDPQSISTNFTISRYRKVHSLEVPLYFDYALTSMWGIQLGINNSFTLAASQDQYEPFNMKGVPANFAYATSSSFEPLPYHRYVPALLLGTDWHWKKKNSLGAEITYSMISNYQNHSQLKVLASPTVKRFLGRLIYTRKF